jgi:LPXTG-site transpeptidase (sortase) family protein
MIKQRKSILRKTTFFGALFAGAILASYLIVNWPALDLQIRYLANRLPTSVPIPVEQDYLQIPIIGVQAPIIWSETDDKNVLQKNLLLGIVHFPETAKPGENGNGVYIGHSSNYWWEKSDYNTVFGLLEKLENGDNIVLNYNGQAYKYQVTANKIVAKDDPEIFSNTPQSEITLVTCWPRGTNLKNFYVRADLVE